MRQLIYVVMVDFLLFSALFRSLKLFGFIAYRLSRTLMWCIDASMIENALEGLMKVDHVYHVECDDGQEHRVKALKIIYFSDNFISLSPRRRRRLFQKRYRA
jgi:hypothetical protein